MTQKYSFEFKFFGSTTWLKGNCALPYNQTIEQYIKQRYSNANVRNVTKW